MTSSSTSAHPDCKFCNRIGLPLLPARIAYVPGAPDSLPAAISHQARVPSGLTQGHYALRVITEGYVYLYDERAGGFWRCFGATPTGQFREYPLDAVAALTPPFQCSLTGHGDVASLVSIENASEAGLVWAGYSRTMLTKAIRAKLKSNLALRSEMMVKFDAKAVVKGGAMPPDAGVRLGNAADLRRLVPEYAQDAASFKAVDTLYTSGTMNAAVDRTGHADPLLQRMQAISPGNAVLLALPDVVGIAHDVNQGRNLLAGTLAKYYTEQALTRNRITGDILLGIENALKKGGKEKDWDEQYASHLDVARLHADKAAFDNAAKAFEDKIVLASADWQRCVSAPPYAHVWQLYDLASNRCGADLERDFTYCVSGSGAVKKEQSIWDAWFAAAADDKDHPLWIALAAGDKELIEFLTHEPGKTADVGKTDKLTDGTRATMEGFKAFEEWRHEHRAKGLVRAATAESGLLGNLVASQLSRLAMQDAAKALVVGTRLRMIIATRLDVVITPVRLKATVEQLVVELHETVWGPPTARLSKTIIDARKMKIAQSVEGAWLGTHSSAAQIVEIDVWLPEEVAKEVRSSQRLLAGPAEALALPGPTPNAWSGFAKYSSGLGGVLCMAFGALQLLNLSAVLIQTNKVMKSSIGNKDGAREEAIYGITSGVLGVGGVVAEVTANVAKRRIMKYTMINVASRLGARAAWFGLAGGLLSTASAWTEGVQLFMKSQDLGAEGNGDARTAYFIAGSALFVSGAASAIVTVIGAGELLAAAGATGALATSIVAAGGILACIPVAGWIALAVGALALALYAMYRGLKKEDTPLQRWMARCCYRNAKYASTKLEAFKNGIEEMDEFQLALYGVHIALDWDNKWFGKDEIDVEVVMPGYGKNSEYAYLLELTGKTWKTPIDRKTSAFSEDADLKPRQTQLYFSAVDPNRKMIPMDEVLEIVEPMSLRLEGGTATLAIKVKANEKYYSKARLKLEYWPDPINFPDLKMTPVPGGVNFAETSS